MNAQSKKITIVSVLAAAALFAAPDAAGQAETGSEPVFAVNVVAKSGFIDESLVKSYLSTVPGKPLDRAGVSSDVRALLDSKRFSDVSAGVRQTASGPVVTFTVVPRRTLAAEPSFTGLSWLSRSRAEKECGLKPGDFVDDAVARVAAGKILDHYRKHRFFSATVAAVVADAPDAPGGALVRFDVAEGKRGKMDFLKFPGAKSIPESELGRAARLHDWFNPVSWVVEPRISDADLASVASDALSQYVDAGYLDAKVSPPRKAVSGDRVSVSYDVSEGALWRIRSISISGVTLYPEREVRACVALKPGDAAGAKAMEEARAAVRDYYASRGRPDTKVSMTTLPVPGNRIDLALAVEEGPLVHIRNILVRGNSVTYDKVLRREIGLSPGDAYDTVQAERSRRRLLNLGYFEDVRTYDTVVDAVTRDLYYDVDERPTGSLSFGAGFSSVDHLVGLFGISQSNFDIFNWPTFRGGGQKARLDLTVGSDSTDLDVSLVEPWFLDRRLSLDIDGFIHNRSFSEYDEKRFGGSVGLAKMVPWVGRVGIDYGLEHVSMDDVTREKFHLADDPEKEFSFLDEDDSYLLGSMRLSWIYDTRDNALVPHRGTRAQAWAKLYNAAFGSEYDFYELSIKASTYFTLPFGFYLSLSGRAATVDGMGGDDVPIGSRYFLGGGRYVRGFRYRAIGPKALSDDFAGDYSAIGGQSMLWATAELSLPIVEKIRIAGFCDAGNVWRDAWDAQLDDLAFTYGCGLRFDFTGFPIRLDYALVARDPDEWAEHRRFVFWIGFDN
ncbi:MAG: outer membrane protein assembly factor BamA [Kiritimatiellae bacterium]|nr:outer membrane protein assembly factor BamA [Kiritimatiellia bacterium]